MGVGKGRNIWGVEKKSRGSCSESKMDEKSIFKRKLVLHFLEFEIYKLTYFKSEF